MKTILFAFLSFLSLTAFSQSTYEDSINTYLKNYVQRHGVVKDADKSQLHFYDVNKTYRVLADFEAAKTASWISFKTSGTKNQSYRLYGTATFYLQQKQYRLNLYQSQDLMTNPEYIDYLFLPFTDSTSGNETYSGGRYLDFKIADVQNSKLVIDFNKAYNPYCAYVSGVYNCPLPPKENALAVAIKAGEKAFTKAH